MSTRGWAYLRDTYATAWRERTSTGDSSDSVLVEAFRRSTPPEEMSATDLPGPVLLRLWNSGVEPRRLHREVYKGMGRAIWNATGVPARQVYDAFRGPKD